jgi:hypothetical protein
MSAKRPKKSGAEKRAERELERDAARERANLNQLESRVIQRRRGLASLLGGGGETGRGGPQPAGGSGKLGVGI